MVGYRELRDKEREWINEEMRIYREEWETNTKNRRLK
jgi:hypothetical protein